MSSLNVQSVESWDFEPIDGIHEVQARRRSRLWYRQAETQAVRKPPVREVFAPLAVILEPGPAPQADQLAEIARIAIAAGRKASAQASPLPAPREASADSGAAAWQIVPESCPA